MRFILGPSVPTLNDRQNNKSVDGSKDFEIRGVARFVFIFSVISKTFETTAPEGERV